MKDQSDNLLQHKWVLYCKAISHSTQYLLQYLLLLFVICFGLLQKNPNEMVRAVIGMGGNAFTRELRSLIYESKIVTVATKEDSVEFESVRLYLFFTVNPAPGNGRKKGNVLFNDALNTFYLWLYGIRHMVEDHSDSERGNPLPPHGLLFPKCSKGSFIYIIPQTG